LSITEQRAVGFILAWSLAFLQIAFTTSRASEMKTRAKEALSINLYSEKYIRMLQMLETQLKMNRKGNFFF